MRYANACPHDAVVTADARPPNEFVQSVGRALAVIRAFGHDRSTLTLTEVAEATGLTRATARRFLLTLQTLGYVGSEGRGFFLRPKVLDLGYSYLSSVPLWEVAQGHMEGLVERLRESCSASVLDGTEIIYTVRVPTKRIMSTNIEVGTRLPAYATSMGRVLLAALDQPALRSYFDQADLIPMTPRTIIAESELRRALDDVRRQGWCLLDQELEIGVRSVAAPLRDRRGRVFAAMNVSSHASRVTLEQLRREHLPLLLETTAAIDRDVRARR